MTFQPRSQDFCLGGAKPQDNFLDSVARSLRSHNTCSPLSTLDKNYISPRMLKSAIGFMKIYCQFSNEMGWNPRPNKGQFFSKLRYFDVFSRKIWS